MSPEDNRIMKMVAPFGRKHAHNPDFLHLVPLAQREPLTEDHRCSNSGIGASRISPQRCPTSILQTTSLLESGAALRVKTSTECCSHSERWQIRWQTGYFYGSFTLPQLVNQSSSPSIPTVSQILACLGTERVINPAATDDRPARRFHTGSDESDSETR